MAATDNKVYFGLSNVHVAFSNGEGTWETPVHVPGAVELTTDAEGDQNIFYADNGPYYTANANAGYTGELTMADIPDEILSKMLGWLIDDNGALVEISDGVPTTFALMFEIQGDKVPRRHVIYNVTLSRPSDDYQTTEDTTEINPPSFDYTATVVNIDGRNLVTAKLKKNETNGEQFDQFFKQVYVPTFAAE